MDDIRRQGDSFLLGDDDAEPLAQILFHRSADRTIFIDHTEVSESLKGQGVGALLVGKVVDLARLEKVGIVPLCPFARKALGKGGFEDVLREG